MLKKITSEELQQALKKMRKRKGADKSNVVVELVKSGSELLHEKLLEMYNSIISTGVIPQSWQITIFHMLPKGWEFRRSFELAANCYSSDTVQDFCADAP